MAKKEYELSELVSFMQANRVLRVRMGGLEVDLSPSAFASPEPLKQSDLESDKGVPNEDELLRWSVPGAFMETEDIVKANG